MNTISFTNSEKKRLKNLGITCLILFGSQAQRLTHTGSDIDIGILTNPMANRKKIYDMLFELISDKIKKPIDIDIVFLESAPLEMKEHILRYGVVLFETDGNAFPNFKERAITELADLEPIRKMFEEQILARIP